MQRTAEGFTILICAQESCARRTSPVLTALGALVRSSRHGVLVRAGCPLGGSCCGSSLGTYAVVQPCDRARIPTSPAVHVGPLRSPDDVADLAGWIHAGTYDHAGLPTRLRSLDRAKLAAQN